MSLLLFLLISYVTAEFNPTKCLAAFQKIETITFLTQEKLQQVCTDVEEKDKHLAILTNIVTECGLSDWSTSTSKTERKIGGLVDGLIDYTGELLCEQVEDLYCFEQLLKYWMYHMLLIFFFAVDAQIKNNQMPDFSVLDLKCNVLQKPEVVNAICPGGSRKNPPRMCQKKMVQGFERAVRKIKRVLQRILPEAQSSELLDLTAPLLNIAEDVKAVCNKKKRQATLEFAAYSCLDGVEPPTAAPGSVTHCMDENPITDECLYNSDFCKRDEKPECNEVAAGIQAALLSTISLNADLGIGLVLKDKSTLTLQRAKDICCNQTCQAALANVGTCDKLMPAQVEFELTMDGTDLPATISSLSPAQLEELSRAVCIDQGAQDGFDPAQCYSEFFEVAATSRRLMDETKSIGVRLTINSTSTKPLSCESDGSLSGFDQVIAENNPNATDAFSQSNNCSCTVGDCFEEPEVSGPPPVETTSSESEGEEESSSNVSEESSVTTKYCTSFAMLSILFMFVKNI